MKIRQETGTTILIIEHDMPLLRSVSDEILALETGRVLTSGEPDEVLEDPRLIAAYLGSDRAVVERSGTASNSASNATSNEAFLPPAGEEPTQEQPVTA